jgi:hypothetical protein
MFVSAYRSFGRFRQAAMPLGASRFFSRRAFLIDHLERRALALTGTDPLSPMKADPADARLLVSDRGGVTSS